MTRHRWRVLAWVGGIALCGVAFYLAATRSFEFAVAGVVRDMLRALPPSGQAMAHVVFSHLPVDEDPAAWLVRKAASVIFFGIVAVLARVVAGGRVRTRSARSWLVLAAGVGMSAAIEVYEWPEPFGDIAFDLACGLIGGLLALLALRLLRRL